MTIESARAFVAKMRKDTEFKRQILAAEYPREKSSSRAPDSISRNAPGLFGKRTHPRKKRRFDAAVML